ncbi:MAG: alpha/beta fold hydrolase [Acidimicrobiales bacterium]
MKLGAVQIAYEVRGDGPAVVLVCGCGQAAVAWHLGLVAVLVDAGYQVVTFDNRGVAPSSSPPAPYSIDDLVEDTLGLIDHLGLARVHMAGYSMGGWVAETTAIRHPERLRSACFIGSCNVATSWEKAITTVELELAKRDADLPRLFYATETLRYLPNHALQDDTVVDGWLSLIADLPPWPNPGREGQYSACLSWSLDLERTRAWPSIAVPCLVLSFEHDIDSPPARAKEAASRSPGAQFVQIQGASHLGPMTHTEEVAQALVRFWAEQ